MYQYLLVEKDYIIVIEKMMQKKGGEFIHNFVLFITDARAIYIYRCQLCKM